MIRIQAIVTDIEGTTSALSFVTEGLYPYARAHLPAFVRERSADPEVQQALGEVERFAGRRLSVEEAIAQLLAWMEEDRKITPLKTLQGLVWERGFASGALTTHFYPDVAPQLRAWKASGIRLYVYSSGSTFAQRLIFGHSPDGDLTPLFDGFFDTTTGAKTNPASYRSIAAALGLPPQAIAFLSDNRRELDAARTAGLRTVWLVRNGPVDHGVGHRKVRDFHAADAAVRQ
ncbi:acireductone synthase [Pelomicrobium sp.]|jgi:enolase-phosphatase E1|uniref:acireductone synthase n=1 Tax=Pelomicrobium sp. TaxID=2815319 RepID=UPI002FDE5E88